MLRGMGAALVLPWMESLPAFAQTAAAQPGPPVRMCFWYVPNGVHLPTWFPKAKEHWLTCLTRHAAFHSHVSTSTAFTV